MTDEITNWTIPTGHGSDREAIRTVTLIESTWSNMPLEVRDEVQELWIMLEYGNDVYYYSGSIQDLEEWAEGANNPNFKVDNLCKWLRMNGFKDEDRFLLHHWW